MAPLWFWGQGRDRTEATDLLAVLDDSLGSAPPPTQHLVFRVNTQVANLIFVNTEKRMLDYPKMHVSLLCHSCATLERLLNLTKPFDFSVKEISRKWC